MRTKGRHRGRPYQPNILKNINMYYFLIIKIIGINKRCSTYTTCRRPLCLPFTQNAIEYETTKSPLPKMPLNKNIKNITI